eukprot:TRINITY_DN64702_c0_g1_i1.p1 TRINITY_DN64702_c0_g1~~TRINITY_DN64702_c0_g1_i1.p1  ORF type:complete len:335 (+),score=55.93 TRINITY_DN64702_c0_g1_i1:72-1076(+)
MGSSSSRSHCFNGMLRSPKATGSKPQVARTPSYAFELHEEESWLLHLRSHGFVVVRGVGSTEQVDAAKDLLWSAISERFTHVRRDDSSTWDFQLRQTGLVPWLAQSAGAWAVRGWPKVKQAFAHIWDTDDLIVSMDCVLVWRPWWVNQEWKPSTEGLHLDQNPFRKPGFECVQGMVPLMPVTASSGGLQVVPDSNQDAAREDFKRRHPQMEHICDWCPCDDDYLNEKAVLVHAAAGDLILWDSRTVHGGLVGTGELQDSSSVAAELARLSVTVAMTARSRADDFVQQRRRDGFRRGENFNHVPHEAGTSSGTVRAPVRRNFQAPALSDAQLALL